jgi:hypothetical protein
MKILLHDDGYTVLTSDEGSTKELTLTNNSIIIIIVLRAEAIREGIVGAV